MRLLPSTPRPLLRSVVLKVVCTPCRLRLMICSILLRTARRRPRKLWLMLPVLLMNCVLSRTMLPSKLMLRRLLKAMVDAARLADELRAEQDHVTQQANAKKALESQLGDMESRLNDANEHAMRGGRQAMAKLESRVRALELELG